ncbi:MAG: DUF4157 domain-containing protein, partial [Actinobacteria bacterium]|nr:DUF4157 domain-containing protein [Actinomycetota bacterium]
MHRVAGPTSDGSVLDDDDMRVSRLIQRRPAPSEATIGLEGGPVDAGLERDIGSARSGGRPLPSTVLGRMEGAMGADLRGVRVHAGTEADALNRSMQSRAFTVGSDIFFAQGQYRPGSTSGQHLLAHELTHTLQQDGSAHRLQRAIGFEFESESAKPAQLTRALNTQERKAKPSRRTIPLADVRWYKKKDVLSRGSGFELQADEDMNNKDALGRTKASIEFVTKPFAETPAGLKELQGAVKGITKMGQTIAKMPETDTAGREWMWSSESTMKALKVPGNAVMKAPGGGIQVKMQASAGFSLASLPSLLGRLGFDYNLPGNQLPTDLGRSQLVPMQKFTRVSKIMADSAGKGRDAVQYGIGWHEWNWPDTRALEGLLSFFTAAVRMAHGAGQQPYAKSLYPLMHRTDFAGMFSLLPTEQKLALRGDGACEAWLELVQEALGDLDMSEQLITATNTWTLNLTIEDWARDIAKGRDRFTEAYQAWSVRQNTAANTPAQTQGLENANYMEGLGSLGSKTDALPGGEKGIVLEMRTIQKDMINPSLSLDEALQLAVRLHD